MMSVGLTFGQAVEAQAEAGLVGPNAVIQLAEALQASLPGAAERVFGSIGLLRLLRQPPDAMIDEGIPARLFEALWSELPAGDAAFIAYEAGRRTGAYLLANRIPMFARMALRALPPRLSSRLLLRAIGRNAWTFAGSGQCRVSPADPAILTIAANPLSMPGCIWHIAVFETLFRALVDEGTMVRHSGCHMGRAPVCRFEIDWRAGTDKERTFTR